MKGEQWKEYRIIEAAAEGHEQDARHDANEGDSRHAQVSATLAVSARLEALSYVLRHATINTDTLL